MLDNNTYNIMMQLIEESQSLWRIRNDYMKDSGHCDECKEFWMKLQKDKDEHIKDLERLLKKHMQ